MTPSPRTRRIRYARWTLLISAGLFVGVLIPSMSVPVVGCWSDVAPIEVRCTQAHAWWIVFPIALAGTLVLFVGCGVWLIRQRFGRRDR